MEQLLKDLNIIEDNSNEIYIGKVENIMQLFLELIKIGIDTIGNNEETLADIEEKLDFLKSLQKLKEEDKDAIIKVHYNPMGEFVYKIV